MNAFGKVWSRQTMTVFAALLLATSSSVSFASLRTAYPYYQKMSAECRRGVDDFLSSAEKREDYDAVESLGDSCERTLVSMISEFQKIGQNFKDSENQSWADSARRELVSAADQARQRAIDVKQAGYDETSAKDELEALKSSLVALSDEFVDSHDSHLERLGMLGDKTDDIGRRWREEFADDGIGYEIALDRLLQLEDEEVRLEQKFREALAAGRRASEKFEALKGDMTVTKEEVQEAANEMSKQRQVYLNAEVDAVRKRREASDQREKVQQEWDNFVNAVKESTGMLSGNVAATVNRMGEFAREFQPFL